MGLGKKKTRGREKNQGMEKYFQSFKGRQLLEKGKIIGRRGIAIRNTHINHPN